SVQKGRAQLSVKAHRHRPSRSCYRDIVSSMEGDESLEQKVQHTFHHRPGVPSCQVRCSPQEDGSSLATPPRGRYHQLTNTTSQEALVSPGSSSSRPRPSSDSRAYTRILVPASSPADPGCPDPMLDKKTKRRFLDLGVTLRRSYIWVRKDKSRRWVQHVPNNKHTNKKQTYILCVVLRELSQSPSRSSGSFISFSWFTEGRAALSSSGTPVCSPMSSPRARKFQSQESALSEEFSPPPTSPPAGSSCRFSHPYQTLSQSSNEASDGLSCPLSSWSTQQVCQWLKGLNMDEYVPEFSARHVDGRELLQMDGSKLKGLGVLSSSDRGALKRRVKEIQTAAKKEKKAAETPQKSWGSAKASTAAEANTLQALAAEALKDKCPLGGHRHLQLILPETTK
uniref:SAM domain-containing protein n=1 Tax=Mola mola TaxID=94237 RepID=A0A3Q3VME2_MOLML